MQHFKSVKIDHSVNGVGTTGLVGYIPHSLYQNKFQVDLNFQCEKQSQ